jgi:hypothetical protein
VNPFRQKRAGRVRFACQIVHLEHLTGGTLIDLVTLEPSRWAGRHVAAGTPFALGFATTDAVEQDQLDTTMGAWEEGCAVLEVTVEDGKDYQRYQFVSERHQLVVTVEDPGEPGA